MAYDPKDASDVAIVTALVGEAVEAANDTHAVEVARLDKKNKDLLAKLAKARTGEGADTGEVDRLERELEESQGLLRTAQVEARETKRQLTAAERERDSAKTTLEAEATFNRTLVTENALTSALTEAKIAPQFLEASKALLGRDVVVKEIDGKRQAFVNDKAISEYVKEWAASDAGKPFIQAPANGGGGAGNNVPNGGGSQKPLAQMNDAERREWLARDPSGFRAASDAQSLQPIIAT